MELNSQPKTISSAPLAVIIASRIWITLWICDYIKAIFVIYSNKNIIITEISANNAEINNNNIANADFLILTIAIGMLTVFQILLILCALKIIKGKSWARIILIFMGIFSLIGYLANLSNPANIMLSILVFLAIFYTSKKESAKFFADNKKSKSSSR